ncbi:predicted protein [Thalassiosira pseudonana CCMP1335]|uniref:HSF-type DNA-binding domain-containing protein n=1 Tax=Thalassiosira pseudonana TaxID=35128 RepID=B5YLJ8_THAPS|nr:predicted protein [Thalassiosira pseudonana CCMP1335]ACI64245.1 predicted protein [Thalassiosira pseudonana CCMP1335]
MTTIFSFSASSSVAKSTIGDTISQIISSSIFQGKCSFPLNLILMLETVGTMGLEHVISWLPCGTCFMIYDNEVFLNNVLPKFFQTRKQTKIRSFYRKLNRWGFNVSKPQSTKKIVAWSRPNFDRATAIQCLNEGLTSSNCLVMMGWTHGIAASSAKKEKGGGTKVATTAASKKDKAKKAVSIGDDEEELDLILSSGPDSMDMMPAFPSLSQSTIASTAETITSSIHHTQPHFDFGQYSLSNDMTRSDDDIFNIPFQDPLFAAAPPSAAAQEHTHTRSMSDHHDEHSTSQTRAPVAGRMSQEDMELSAFFERYARSLPEPTSPDNVNF